MNLFPRDDPNAAYYAPQQQQSNSYSANNGPPFSTFQTDTVPASMSNNNMYAPEDLSMMDYDNGQDNDLKRRRIARACDMCRKKKIKCDGKMPACSHCVNYKTECIFTQVEKKRAPPKGAKYIESLENRLNRMEQLLQLSGILNDDDDAATDLQTLEQRLQEKNASASPTSGPSADAQSSQTQTAEADGTQPATNGEASSSNAKKPAKAPPVGTKGKGRGKKKDEEVEALSEAMCSLVTNQCGETRYIGSSSGFSIFSPQGIQWINEKTGDTSFQDMVASSSLEDNKLMSWRQDVFGDIFQRKVYQPLPSKSEAMSLLKDYFTHFNCMFPLYNETTFMALAEKHYSRDPYEGSGWWASLNVVLALAHRVRVMSQAVPQEEDQKAWGYLKNAMAVQSELTMRNTDLLSVQALLGMSMFLLGTPNPQPSFFLVAAAIRLAHSLGLHKKVSASADMDPRQIEQRQRVFWIAYMLDKDICLRSGRPPIQDDDDYNVELPSEDPSDNIGNIPLADGKGKVNLFRLMCAFSVIASKVYRNLYSVKASKSSDGEILNAIGDLDKELEDWKDGIPIDFRPEHEIKASHTPLILHVVVLHFAYYNCLTTIHRMSVHHGYWTSRLSNYAIKGLNVRPLNPRVFSSAALCVTAARASINLIKYIPRGDFDCVWMILYYPVSSLVTLFANILQNPHDTRARSDLRLMNHVVEFLSMLCEDGKNTAIRRMLDICAEFARISKVVLDKSEHESASRRKRKVDPDSAQGSPMTNPHLRMGVPMERGALGTNIPKVYSPPAAVTQLPQFTQQPGISAAALSPGDSGNFLSSANSASSLAASPTAVSMPPNFAFDVHSTNGIDLNGMQTTSSMPSGASLGGADDQYSMDMPLQQPFVPPDLWSMPMTLEWDWAEMTGGQQ